MLPKFPLIAITAFANASHRHVPKILSRLRLFFFLHSPPPTSIFIDFGTRTRSRRLHPPPLVPPYNDNLPPFHPLPPSFFFVSFTSKRRCNYKQASSRASTRNKRTRARAWLLECSAIIHRTKRSNDGWSTLQVDSNPLRRGIFFFS